MKLPVIAHRVLRGASWLYGAQLATILLQLVYAGFTSRLLGPSAFGEYAIALSATGIVQLLSSGGLAQTISRVQTVDSRVVRGLATYGFVLGSLGSLAALIFAVPWSELWGSPMAASAVRVLGLSALLAPLGGLYGGTLRREGKFRQVALTTLIGNVAGFTVGVFFVLEFRVAWTLGVSAVVASLVTTSGFARMIDRGSLGLGRIRHAGPHLRFSNQLSAVSVVSYINGNALRVFTGQFVGTASLGVWNRAEVLSSIPIQQIQGSLLQALYPELRRRPNISDAEYLVWRQNAYTTMLCTLGAIAIPLALLAAAVVVRIVPLIFGPGWDAVAHLIPMLFIGGVTQLLASFLGVAIESVGRFGPIFIIESILLVVQVPACLIVLNTGSIIVAVGCYVGCLAARHICGLIYSWRSGQLRLRRVVVVYATAALAGIGVYLLASQSIASAMSNTPLLAIALLIATFALAAAYILAATIKARAWHRDL